MFSLRVYMCETDCFLFNINKGTSHTALRIHGYFLNNKPTPKAQWQNVFLCWWDPICCNPFFCSIRMFNSPTTWEVTFKYRESVSDQLRCEAHRWSEYALSHFYWRQLRQVHVERSRSRGPTQCIGLAYTVHMLASQRRQGTWHLSCSVRTIRSWRPVMQGAAPLMPPDAKNCSLFRPLVQSTAPLIPSDAKHCSLDAPWCKALLPWL